MKNISNQKGIAHLGLVVVAGFVLGVVGLAGWRVATTNGNNNASIVNSEDSLALDQLPSDLSDLKSIEEIQAIAMQGNSDTISGIELELDDGVLAYVVHFSNGNKVAYNAKTGEVINHVEDNDDDINESDNIPSDFVPGISLTKAIEIAQLQHPGVSVSKVELELEEGTVVYSVRFTDKSRVDVNAADGTILKLRDESNKEVNSNGETNNNGTSDDSATNSSSSYQDDDGDESDDDYDDNDKDDDDDDDDQDDDKDDDSSSGNSGPGSN